MINIIVRDGAVITNELTEYQFMDMVAAVHGPEKTLDEYIEVFNQEAHANGSTVRVHKDPASELEAIADADELEDHQLPIDEIVTYTNEDQDPNPFLDKLAELAEEEKE